VCRLFAAPADTGQAAYERAGSSVRCETLTVPPGVEQIFRLEKPGSVRKKSLKSFSERTLDDSHTPKLSRCRLPDSQGDDRTQAVDFAVGTNVPCRRSGRPFRRVVRLPYGR
jgi:hypothetical protein